MSKRLSFRELFDRQADTWESAPAPLSSPIEIRISLQSDFSQLVELAKILKLHGLTLTQAHAVISDLAEFGTVSTAVEQADIEAARRAISELGLGVELKKAVGVSQEGS